MLTAKKPDNEQSRLASLHALDVLDSAPEDPFDALVRAAAYIAGTPISLLSLVDTHRQWFKANMGLPGITETSRDAAFCAHTILQDEVMEVEDASRDPRFADNPLVVGGPQIRFYAGAPIRLDDGACVGSLCVIDRAPHKLTTEQLDLLQRLARAAAAALKGRRAIHLLSEASGEMHYHATHDALTGLVNRSEFESRLRRVLQKAAEDRSEHALLYIDIDQFKLVNDSCGHAIGDQLLQQVGKLFADAIRTRDTLARLGGDEFAIILEHCSAEQAQRVAQQICDAMATFRFMHDERSFRVGVSIGLVPVDDRWTTAAAIMQAADASCYAAKEGGRNRVHLWFDTDTAIRVRAGEMQWAMRIEQALDNDQFVLFAQRIEELGKRSHGIRAEALLRMVQDDGDLVPPGAFLPAAERFHLASRIDRWVMQHALAWLEALPDPLAIHTLSINLSGHSIGDRAFHRHAIESFREAGPRICQQVCVEITETAAVTNLGDAAAFIARIRALGVAVALDDFGSGASSFGYLKNLPVDYLKIDGQFVQDVVDDPLDEAAVRCFAEVARVVGVKTVAEFVDRPEVLAKLRTLGIDYAQGFLLHRPAPLNDLLRSGAVACV
ncbi:MAG: EAL domain-containing protein [Proteobacteria bacterium]|nr:EAL domain-containing protein [Pseudomonadota bacterium]